MPAMIKMPVIIATETKGIVSRNAVNFSIFLFKDKCILSTVEFFSTNGVKVSLNLNILNFLFGI